jgi:hypothetical protein
MLSLDDLRRDVNDFWGPQPDLENYGHRGKRRAVIGQVGRDISTSARAHRKTRANAHMKKCADTATSECFVIALMHVRIEKLKGYIGTLG